MEFKMRIKNLTSLTIGGGSVIVGTDIPFSELEIPSSSIKGVLRTAVTQFLPQGFTSCNEVEPKMIRQAHRGKEPCDVCQLFGYPDARTEGCVNFMVETKDLKKYRLMRVSIEDKTQKAKEGALFSQEVVKPGTEVVVNVIYRDNCGERLLKLLLSSVLALRYWRLGRNALVDVKLEEDLCKRVKCDPEMGKIVGLLTNYMW
ncbi:RAMP superfamily CRISPR-associated protein [Sulfolobus acidocaldarius]|uniref:Conserved protein n=3 Tax=Sulfolobus acidocaldarius TaxID=2285 RepID=Q4J790_SULAC|nr:RAMP superfamily CRISPR-associated protein [Sulfolobus acidocaldarius]AAY81341.1 conserved protein [Sulfolobus acidocaldarius DSM 639]AGE74255.1 hypothetical protein SacRon12I_10185 [Sulfolobus acidocaldarius Ron12/I]ALU29859.1 hypothetical protein ATY89_07850 [Sulfolobus acidocaldarius]ALU32599.1 hypothetical protein ATZ20_10870 [Sulfolobus acidocaldarius]WCM35843.1 hypothetical protein GO597_11140 [Sulfolobus acidocaldarius DSM 639]